MLRAEHRGARAWPRACATIGAALAFLGKTREHTKTGRRARRRLSGVSWRLACQLSSRKSGQCGFWASACPAPSAERASGPRKSEASASLVSSSVVCAQNLDSSTTVLSQSRASSRPLPTLLPLCLRASDSLQIPLSETEFLCI